MFWNFAFGIVYMKSNMRVNLKAVSSPLPYYRQQEKASTSLLLAFLCIIITPYSQGNNLLPNTSLSTSASFAILLSALSNFEMSQVFYMKALCKTMLVLILLPLPIKVSEISYIFYFCL